MKQEQDLMSTMKRLNRVKKEGGSMTSDERAFFDETLKKSKKLELRARASTSK
ncbi:hypothetical protein [Spirosoma radiotolerans]|uniref:hypothetical protein n=1 Tax=Spirosoma radiotolerans TaxID=1379870 RepID=UPI00130D83D6|nr:hypothetical protein [Spirosoma radiotolerans]